MSVEIGILVHKDFTKMQRLLNVLPGRADTTIQRIGEGIVADLRAHWSPTAPSSPGNPPAKRTGRLDASLTIEKRASRVQATAVITAKAPYARYLEFGTRRMAARPFLRPAVERARARLGETTRAALFQAR